MISLLHIFINILIKKKTAYIIDFLKLPNEFQLGSPHDFKSNWVLNKNGDFMIEVSFIDISLYEYLADNSGNKKQIKKWLNRVNTHIKSEQDVCKWRLRGFKVVDDDGQKRTSLNFCQW